MDARKKSFMLLPDFYYKPDQGIALGRVLPVNHDTKLPDPDEPLSVQVTVAEDRIVKQSLRPFEFEGDTTRGTSVGLNAALSLFTGVGAGVENERESSTTLKITSEIVMRTRFIPTREEMASLLSNQLIASILDLRSRPSLYFITGMLVASGAEIQETTGRQRNRGMFASADLTSLQVPLSLGADAQKVSDTNVGTTTTIEGEFILGYQLVRIQKKLFGKAGHNVERKWALFDDNVSVELQPALEDYIFEPVGVHEDEEAAEQL